MFSPDFSHLSNSDLLRTIGVKEPAAYYDLSEMTADAYFLERQGIPKNQVNAILAAWELKKRIDRERALKSETCFTSSKKVADYCRTLYPTDSHVEQFHALYLNRRNNLIKSSQISSGGITGTVADPRVILREALLLGKCTSIILTHNHPSGNTKPSRADEDLTRKIKEAARFMDITVLDHVIICGQEYFSFADEGIL